jgi:hypothetical protein
MSSLHKYSIYKVPVWTYEGNQNSHTGDHIKLTGLFIAVAILDIIHRPLLFKARIPETEKETSSIYWAHLIRSHLKEERESNLQNVVL